MKNFKIVTSNINKLNEFIRFGLRCEAEIGLDLPEVLGTIDEVILYKAIEAGPNKIVEDTVLTINGEEIVDIRWRLNDLKEGSYARWTTSLAINDGTDIIVYRGIIEGTLVKPNEISGFGFDPYFSPWGTNRTLADLEAEGKKDLYSARKIACDNLMNNKYITRTRIIYVPKWKGSYQHI